MTPANGTYSFPQSRGRHLRRRRDVAGLQDIYDSDVTVNIGAIVRVDAKLALGALEESVIVTGERRFFRPTARRCNR